MKLVLICAIAIGCVAFCSAGEIHDAAREGNLERVRALVAASPLSVNARDKGTTPLHEAARGGHLNVVRFLIDKGANPNVNNISRTTPLKLALGYRRADVAEYLRQRGALESIETRPAAQEQAAPVRTPAPPMTAAPTARTQVAPPVQARPPIPSPTNAAAGGPAASHGTTNRLPSVREMLPVLYPIHEAARIGDVEQIKFLFKSFTDLIESTDEKGRTPLHIAVENKQFEAAKALVGLRAKVNARSDTGQTPLHVAARTGSSALVALLLGNQANPNARDNFDSTPLLLATQPLDDDPFQGLSEQDARARFRSPQQRASTVAAQEEQLKLVKLLVDHRADVNARNRAGASCVSQAVLNLNARILELLVRAGADPNVADPTTRATPLHMAAARGLQSSVALLLEAKAEINAKDARGETPTAHALHGGHTAVANLLKQRGGNTGAERSLNVHEQSLVGFFRQTDSALQRASAAGKAQIIIDMSPGKADTDKMFPRHAGAAWTVVSEMRKQIKQSFQSSVADTEHGKEIWRIRPEGPTALTREWLDRGWLNPSLPVYSLVVDRVGATSNPGDYCFVNQRWVLVPPLRIIGSVPTAATRAR